MIYTSNFFITGLKRVSSVKTLKSLFKQYSDDIAKQAETKGQTVIDFKSFFESKVPKTACNNAKSTAPVILETPEVSFYSEEFVNKMISMLKAIGCDIPNPNPNKIPRFLYHLTTKSNYENMLKSGVINPAKEGLCGENIFMLDLKNFFSRWTKFNLGGSHQKRLLKSVSGKNKEDVVMLKIPTKILNREKLGIRSQDVLYSNAEYIGGEQEAFMKKYSCKTEEELLQLLETDENALNKFAEMFKRYLHITRGTSAGNQRLFTTRKDAIEYIYPETIDIKNVQKIGQINPSEFELAAEYNREKPMQSVLGKMLCGQPEQKATLLIQG